MLILRRRKGDDTKKTAGGCDADMSFDWPKKSGIQESWKVSKQDIIKMSR